MKLKFFFLSLFLLITSFARGSSSVWGKLVYLTDKNIPYHYAVYFEQDGKAQGYFIENSLEKMKAREHADKFVQIKGTAKEVPLKIKNKTVMALVFVPDELKSLSLADLAVKTDKDSHKKSNGGVEIEKYLSSKDVLVNSGKPIATVAYLVGTVLQAFMGGSR